MPLELLEKRGIKRFVHVRCVMIKINKVTVDIGISEVDHLRVHYHARYNYHQRAPPVQKLKPSENRPTPFRRPLAPGSRGGRYSPQVVLTAHAYVPSRKQTRRHVNRDLSRYSLCIKQLECVCRVVRL
jgi:hypothetical protein